MAYQALYRKFRPPVFDDVLGQEHIVTTLRNQITSGRIAHAYLFCGTRGTGKTSVAKIMARAVNCENLQGANPCGTCEVCRATLAGSNLNVAEIDAASNNGVDNIREIVDEVNYSPTMGRYKVYIIDEVHMLSTGAFNALLKTLEEPPSYVIFILATTEVQKIPITILSRCQRYDFRRLTTAVIRERLAQVAGIEGIRIEDEALSFIARSADGAMRDGLSLLDRCLAFYNEETLTFDKVLDILGAADTEVFVRLFRSLTACDIPSALTVISDLVSSGGDLAQFVGDFVWFLRNLMLLHASDVPQDAIDVSAENYQQMKELCDTAELETILSYIRLFSELTTQIRYSTQKRILTETAVIRACKPQMDRDSDTEQMVAERLFALEREMDRTERALREIKKNGVIPAQTMTGGQNPLPATMKKKTVPVAVPEDIRKIAENWQGIVMKFSQPTRSMLQEVTPMMDAEGRLVIAATTQVNAMMFESEEGRDHLREELMEVAGKDVPFTVTWQGKDVAEPELYALSELLGFDVDIEDT